MAADEASRASWTRGDCRVTPESAPSTAWMVAVAAAALFGAAYPVVAALFVSRRLGTGWRYVAQGAAVFLVFQVLTRIPAVQLLQAALLPSLQESALVRWGWLIGLSVSA